jgi:hypothetical protein
MRVRSFGHWFSCSVFHSSSRRYGSLDTQVSRGCAEVMQRLTHPLVVSRTALGSVRHSTAAQVGWFDGVKCTLLTVVHMKIPRERRARPDIQAVGLVDATLRRAPPALRLVAGRSQVTFLIHL